MLCRAQIETRLRALAVEYDTKAMARLRSVPEALEERLDRELTEIERRIANLLSTGETVVGQGRDRRRTRKPCGRRSRARESPRRYTVCTVSGERVPGQPPGA